MSWTHLIPYTLKQLKLIITLCSFRMVCQIKLLKWLNLHVIDLNLQVLASYLKLLEITIGLKLQNRYTNLLHKKLIKIQLVCNHLRITNLCYELNRLKTLAIKEWLEKLNNKPEFKEALELLSQACKKWMECLQLTS